jgi:hypothetical protein
MASRSCQWQWLIQVRRWEVRYIPRPLQVTLMCRVNALKTQPCGILCWSLSFTFHHLRPLLGALRPLDLASPSTHSKWRLSGHRILIPMFSTTRARHCGIRMWATGRTLSTPGPEMEQPRSPQPQELPSPSLSQVRKSLTVGCVVWC